MVAGYLYLYHLLNCTLPDVTRPALSESYDNPDLACEDSSRHVEVGYHIDDTLVPVLDACFNETTLVTTYTKHRLSKWVSSVQAITRPPPTYYFFQLEFFRVDVQSLFRSGDSILASLDLDGYINDTHFIKIGNLAPYEDFFYTFQRDATYHLANSAPQWNTFDEGNWKVVEQGVLDFSQDAFVYGDATVLTGTLKVATLANSSGVPVEIYLYYGRIPVPRWFWKLIYYDDFNVGVIFFGFNNPYASKNEVDTEFLTEVCSVDVFESAATSWHLEDVDNTDPALGYIYACRVNLDEILDPLVNSIVSNVLPMEIRRADIF